MKKAFDIISDILFVCLMVFVVSFRIFMVEGSSMETTLNKSGVYVLTQRSWIKKIYPLGGEIKRGDIAVVKVNDFIPSKENSHYIKRVLGLPGERVVVDNGVSVCYQSDCIKISEDYISSTTKTQNRGPLPYYDVGGNSYFVLGDNRENSQDSRGSFGQNDGISYNVPSDSIVKVLYIFDINPLLSKIGLSRE